MDQLSLRQHITVCYEMKCIISFATKYTNCVVNTEISSVFRTNCTKGSTEKLSVDQILPSTDIQSTLHQHLDQILHQHSVNTQLTVG